MSKFNVKVGKREIKLSKAFIERQDCMYELDNLKDCYRQKLGLFEEISQEKDPKKLREFNRLLVNLELEIQELFGFEQSHDHVRFWEFEKCECPKMDNADRWPTGAYIVAGNCPLHGDLDE